MTPFSLAVARAARVAAAALLLILSSAADPAGPAPTVALSATRPYPRIACTAVELARLRSAWGTQGPAHDAVAAVVQRASWPEQLVLRGTLATIAGQAREAGVDRTAMILVGDALRNEGEASLLYDAGFTHGYRRAEEPGGPDGGPAGQVDGQADAAGEDH